MAEVIVCVGPASAAGWRLDCDLPLEPLYFRAGSCAERAARRLACALGVAGHEVRLVVLDRAGQSVAVERFSSSSPRRQWDAAVA